LLFVGDGPERLPLEEEAKRRSLLDNVIFAGVRRDIEHMYAAMDIFTLPSTCEEAFGMVLIEAMAMGKPVIATRVGGIPEIVENEVNGVLVTPHDAAALADAITRCIFDRQFSEKIAAEGRKLVERKFSDKAMGDHFDKVLTQITRR
jgi:glycosyltransferase involved in cell wall biosynthesis